MSLESEERPEPPKHVIIPEIVEKVYDIALCNRRVKVKEFAKIVGTSTEYVDHILNVELDVSKLAFS